MPAWAVAIAAFAVHFVAKGLAQQAGPILGAALRAAADCARVTAIVAAGFWVLGGIASWAIDSWRFDAKLASVERWIHTLQGWHASLVGTGGWRLVVALLAIATAALLMGTTDSARFARAGFSFAKLVRTFGQVLALAAAFTFMGDEATSAVGSYEARLQTTRGTALSRYAEARQDVEYTLRDAALDALDSALQDTCSDVRQDANAHEACIEFHYAEIRRDDGMGREPRTAQRVFWEGEYTALPRTPQPADADELPPDIGALSLNQVEDRCRTIREGAHSTPGYVTGDEPVVRESAARELYGYAAARGYEAAIEAASHAGASGEIVSILLGPFASGPLTSALSEMIAQGVDRVMRGMPIAEATAQLKSRLAAAFSTREGRAKLIETRDAANATVRRAVARSQTLEFAYADTLPPAEAAAYREHIRYRDSPEGRMAAMLRRQERDAEFSRSIDSAVTRANAANSAPGARGAPVRGEPQGRARAPVHTAP